MLLPPSVTLTLKTPLVRAGYESTYEPSPLSTTKFLSQIDYIYAGNVTYNDLIEDQKEEKASNIINNALLKLLSAYIPDLFVINIQTSMTPLKSEFNNGDVIQRAIHTQLPITTYEEDKNDEDLIKL